QFAAQIYRAFAQGGGSRELDYSDVPTNHPQYEAIGQVTKSGFMSGYPEGDFQPNNNVSKLEVLLALASGLNLAVPRDPEGVLQSYYKDVDQIPSWAVPKIAAATEAGMVVNYSDLTVLSPNQSATRAEAAAMLYQALVSNGKAPEVTSEYIVQPQ
ncbi:MAG: S-layer homology domain-containing protein, partial [Symploca sp. SIO2B6]|nr:S-layer homology domain-containing protein [Symploca sp. SIO2B6]